MVNPHSEMGPPEGVEVTRHTVNVTPIHETLLTLTCGPFWTSPWAGVSGHKGSRGKDGASPEDLSVGLGAGGLECSIPHSQVQG